MAGTGAYNLAYGTGTASAPVYTFSGDTNTGMYWLSADKVSLTTGGSDRLTIDSSGNVGIGTIAPLSKLGVVGNASIGATYGAFAGPTSGLAIEGNVGIGTISPLSKLGVVGNARIGATYGAFAGPTSGLAIEGNVGIGTISPLSKLGVVGNASIGATYGAFAG